MLHLGRFAACEPDHPSVRTSVGALPEIVKIARPEDIIFGDRYVLVMNGLSQYDTVHARGATFVVNNSPANRSRAAELAAAMDRAREFATKARIAVIHLIE